MEAKRDVIKRIIVAEWLGTVTLVWKACSSIPKMAEPRKIMTLEITHTFA